MAGPIQVLPPGLLGFLQIKNAGRNPDNLLSDLQPSLNLLEWYLNARATDALNIFGGNGSVNAAGSGALLSLTNWTVPNNTWLYVFEFTVVCSLLAAESIRFAPMLLTFPGIAGQSQLQTGPDYNDVVTARARRATATSYGPFWAPPGSQFAVNVLDALTAGNIAVTGHLRATPLPV